MAKNDVKIYDESAFGYPGDNVYNVAAGAVASIKQGEFVVMTALADAVVIHMATNTPTPATDFVVGLASADSTDTVAAAGTVKVTKFVSGMSYLIAPNVAATWDTQAKYDALVGKRVLIDLTLTSYTILAADNANYGCVIMPLDIKKYPGKVRFSLRNGCNYLA